MVVNEGRRDMIYGMEWIVFFVMLCVYFVLCCHLYMYIYSTHTRVNQALVGAKF